MKLTPKQKEVILAMREKENVFLWLGVPVCKFKFNGKTFRYDLGWDLQIKRLIHMPKYKGGDKYYTLTDLGKTIEL